MLSTGLLILSTFLGGETNQLEIDLSQNYHNEKITINENNYCELDTIQNRLTADCKFKNVNVSFDYILDEKNIFVEMTEVSHRRFDDEEKVFVNYSNTNSLSSVFFLDNYKVQELEFNNGTYSFSLENQ